MKHNFYHTISLNYPMYPTMSDRSQFATYSCGKEYDKDYDSRIIENLVTYTNYGVSMVWYLKRLTKLVWKLEYPKIEVYMYKIG